MSRPNISYPTPHSGPSSSFTQPHVSSRPSLEPSPMPSSSSTEFRRPSGADAGGGGHRSVSSSSSRAPGSLDSHITRLLVTTKQMLQGLDSWSQGNLDEDGVSDIYVRLGNGFELCVTAFQRAGINTTELDSIPNDLRLCLEACLSEDPSQESLNVFLPQIRTIIYNLLNGLKQKQAAYKRLLADRQAALAQPPPPPTAVAPPSPLAPQIEPAVQQRPPPRVEVLSDSRLSARSGTSSVSQTSGGGSPSSTSSQLPTTKVPSSQALAERARAGGSAPSRPAPPDAFRPPRRLTEGARRSVSPSPGEQPQLVRHQLSDNPVPSPPPTLLTAPSPAPPPKPAPPHPDRFPRDSRDSFGNPRPVSRFSIDSEVTSESPVSTSPPKPLLPLPQSTESLDTTPTPSMPPTLPTLNLPSTGLRLSNPPVSEPQMSSLPDVPPETRATLAALGRSDALERRASKRFSSYTFNKLPGSPNHKKAASVGSPQRPTRRADRPPPMPALPESLASANLAVTSDGARTPSPTVHNLALPNGDDQDQRLSSSPGSSRTDKSDTSNEGSVRIIKTPELLPIDSTAQSTPRPPDLNTISPRALTPSSSFTVFLQIGRQVKKTTLESPVTLSSLRLMFMEKFEYDPGMEDFPDVYLRDNQTGVQFELEDMEDLREGCVLSLNIEPLDQVKQHIDLTFSTMMQEIKEMKNSIEQSRRVSMTPAPSLLSVSPSSHFNRPTPMAKVDPSPQVSPTKTVRTNLAPRDVDLRAQQDEIQSLRRDLAVMRQIHVDFLGETKEAFFKLRRENNAMRDLVKTKMGGSRALLDNTKAKLETLCADTIQAVEEISDTIDMAREDAFKRFVTPSRSKMQTIRADLKKAHDMVDTFTREVQGVEPTWRATWHFELSRVMDEQRLLPHQLKLVVDLKQDVKDAEDILKNVSDFVDQRAANIGKGVLKGFRPPTPEEGTGGVPNLLMEIRTKESDPNQRLRAIEAQQKAREKEKAMNQTDEFGDELAGFVQGRKLKKTGGTDEVERQRLRKQEQTIKRMLTGETSGGSPTALLSPQNTGMSILSAQNTGMTVGSFGPSGRASRGSIKNESGDKERS